jgi:DNA polymerase III delta prime subunit
MKKTKPNNYMNTFFSNVSVKPDSTPQKKNNNMSFSSILQRDSITKEITDILTSFESLRDNINFKKGIYIYGSPGSGKTHFAIELLKKLNYDIIKYDAGDVRNKSLIDTITSNNISNRNVLDMMNKNEKKIAIVMDEIDGMNNGDKGGINALIKMIRQKKTKKQRLENVTLNPIICIGNYYMDKKIKELMKVCNVFELKTPSNDQINEILNLIIDKKFDGYETLNPYLLEYIQGDMRKLMFIHNIYLKKPEMLTFETLQNILQIKCYNEDSKKITQMLINKSYHIDEHNTLINETDRTIVALLWHENIADAFKKIKPADGFPLYTQILENICYADYIDRITFQNQIWLFNEMSSLMKTFYNNKIYHDAFPESNKKFKAQEIRFTKVLTKYSTEYNNILFIFNLCQNLDMDRKDIIAFFQELRLQYGSGTNTDFIQSSTDISTQIEEFFENYNITKLDARRMYRYLDKNVKKDAVIVNEFDEDDE